MTPADNHPTADALMRQILQNPADALPRLVFADWLEETGTRSNVAWAKYLRLADEVANLLPNDARRGKFLVEQSRVGELIRAKITLRAELFVDFPDSIQQLLPIRNILLNLETLPVEESLLEHFPESVAREHSMVPLKVDDHTFTIAVPDLHVPATFQTLRFILNREIVPVAAELPQLQAAINRFYGEVEPELTESPFMVFEDARNLTPVANQRESRYENTLPAIRTISLMMHDAIQEGTREITVARVGPRVEVRFLRNGHWQLWGGFPPNIHLPLVARFRWLAGVPSSQSQQSDQYGIIRHSEFGNFYDVILHISPVRSGPQVHITILQSRTEPPAALNPAA